MLQTSEEGRSQNITKVCNRDMWGLEDDGTGDRLERREYWGKGKGTVTLSSPDNQWGVELGAL